MTTRIRREAVRQLLAQAKVDGSGQEPEYVFGVMSALMWVLATRQESPVSKIERGFPPTEREIQEEADLAGSYSKGRLGQTEKRREFCRGVSAALHWVLGRINTPPLLVDAGAHRGRDRR